MGSMAVKGQENGALFVATVLVLTIAQWALIGLRVSAPFKTLGCLMPS